MPKFLFYDSKIINILLKKERPSGGAAVQSYAWIRGLLANGNQVAILSDEVEKSQLKEECQDIEIIADYDPDKGIRWFRWVTYRIPHLYRTLKKYRPDFFYVSIPSWHAYPIGLLCKSLGIRYIQRISNDFLIDDRFYTKYSVLHRFFQDRAFQSADCILCQNDYQLDIISRKFPKKAAFKLPNPIYINAAPAWGEGDRSYIAWLGIFQYQKNMKLLYEIASCLPEETFLVAGKEDKKLDDETELYLQKLHKLPNVRFIGFLSREQVLPFLSRSKFLLNTSHYEGYSNTFLEAMATGTPVITSYKVNPDAIITTKQLGIVYNDAEDLSTRYRALTPGHYKDMAANAYQHVATHHNYQVLAKNLTDLLNSNKNSARTAGHLTNL